MNAAQVANLDGGTLERRKQAVVILSASTTVSGWFSANELPVATQWQKSDRKSDQFNLWGMANWTGGFQNSDSPTVMEVDAGSYDLTNFSYQHGNQRIFNRSVGQAVSPPLGRVVIAAGEVVYLGHLSVALRKDGSQRFELSLTNHEAKARAVLAEKKPELAAKMVTRLATLAPAVAADAAIASALPPAVSAPVTAARKP
jgi:hypothetical protein